MVDEFTSKQVYYIDKLTSRLKLIKGWLEIKPPVEAVDRWAEFSEELVKLPCIGG
jgi:hypothetical protein